MTVSARPFAIAICAALAGCGGGVAGGNGLSARNPSVVDPKTDGPTAAQTLNAGGGLSGNALTSGARLAGGRISSDNGAATGTISGNGLGGYTVSVGGDRFGDPQFSTSLIASDQVNHSKDAWQREWIEGSGTAATRYSLSLWNAGKGHREGLSTDQDGQTYHKIIGYYGTLTRGAETRQARGHMIVGNPTDSAALEARTRSATYKGYYFANAMPADRGSMERPTEVRGGLSMTADFDRNTVSGRSTSFEMRNGDNYVAQDRTLQFGEAAIGSDHFAGTIASDFAPLNGGVFRGRFFGGNAQEMGGMISGDSGSVVTEGFFTAVEDR